LTKSIKDLEKRMAENERRTRINEEKVQEFKTELQAEIQTNVQ